MREDREDEEAMDLASDLSLDGAAFTNGDERCRLAMTGGGAVGNFDAGGGDTAATVDECGMCAALACRAGLETTANEDGGCLCRIGVGMIRSAALSLARLAGTGTVKGGLMGPGFFFSTPELTSRMACMTPSSISETGLVSAVAVVSGGMVIAR